MSKMNCTRSGCKDVFHAFLVKNATYAGVQELPCLQKETAIPEKLILFSKALSSKEYDSWVFFMKMMLLLNDYGIIHKDIFLY